MNGETSPPKIDDKLKPLWWMLAGVSSVWIIYWLLCVFLLRGEGAGEERAQFGDMFGGLNALFSAVAFATLIYTVLLQRTELRLQREELRLQRKELELTRSELKRSADAQSATEATLKEELRVVRLSSLLPVISELMKWEYEHLKQRHKDVVSEFPEQWDDHNLREILGKIIDRMSNNDSRPGDHCARRNLEDLLAMRTRIRAIYKDIGT